LTESCKTFGIRFTCVRGMLYSRNLLRLRLLFVALPMATFFRPFSG